jgi:hypothetical protein
MARTRTPDRYYHEGDDFADGYYILVVDGWGELSVSSLNGEEADQAAFDCAVEYLRERGILWND